MSEVYPFSSDRLRYIDKLSLSFYTLSKQHSHVRRLGWKNAQIILFPLKERT